MSAQEIGKAPPGSNDIPCETLARRMMVDWAALVAEHGPRVWRTAFRILKHHADAHDCYQDAFLAACQIAPRHPGDWGRILTCLATRKAIDRLRARARSARMEPLDAAQQPSTDDDPAQPVRVAELVDRLRAAPPGCRGSRLKWSGSVAWKG